MNDDNTHWISNKDIYYEWMLKLSTGSSEETKGEQELRKFPPEPQLKPFEFIEAEEMII